MSDFIWSVVIGIVFVLLGILFAGIGLTIWKKRKIELLHEYHYDKVSEENKPAYCRLAGIGMLTIGTGLFVSGICTLFTLDLRSLIPMALGIVSGTAILISAAIRYNRSPKS